MNPIKMASLMVAAGADTMSNVETANMEVATFLMTCSKPQRQTYAALVVMCNRLLDAAPDSLRAQFWQAVDQAVERTE